MKRGWQRIKLIKKLGVFALARYTLYRCKLSLGYLKWRLPIKEQALPVLRADITAKFELWHESLECDAELFRSGKLTFFFKHQKSVGSPPRWFYDPFLEKEALLTFPLAHWATIDAFSLGTDIKIIWESSRFYWAPRLAQLALASGEPRYLEELNGWLQNWCRHNPINAGPNWLCAQEAAIRAINFVLALHLLEKVEADEGLFAWLSAHCERIIPSMAYAKAQNNNHASSEAAALYIVGLWLLRKGSKPWHQKARRYIRLGQKHLRERVAKLVLPDGSFAQYSVTYQRLLLDTLSLCVYWQQRYQGPAFSSAFMRSFERAFNWLYQLTDPISFDAPNLGANDGALLFKLDGCDYRDFRPSLQLAAVLLYEKRLYRAGSHESLLTWLGIKSENLPDLKLGFNSQYFQSGGFVKMALNQVSWLLLRLPEFKFRPSQADIFHVDFWHKGENILLDGGTFSYNFDNEIYDYLSSAAAHNTVSADAGPQMPKIGRFLFADWPKLQSQSHLQKTKDGWEWSGAFVNHQGVTHRRSVHAHDKGFTVIDEIKGQQREVKLLWHLAKKNWQRPASHVLEAEGISISIFCQGHPVELHLVERMISKYYLQLEPVLVVEALATEPSVRFETHVVFD